MTNIRYFITADYASVDQAGKLSVNGFFDNFQVSVCPSAAPKFFVVIGFSDLEEDTEFTLDFFDPDGISVAEATGQVRKQPGSNVSNFIMELNDFPLPKRGRYRIEIKESDRAIGTYDFTADWIPEREFKPGEREHILSDEAVIKGAHIKVICPKCGTEKKYELTLLPDKEITEGYEWFPEDNIMRCCDPSLNVDITGMRRQIEWSYGQKLPQHRK